MREPISTAERPAILFLISIVLAACSRDEGSTVAKAPEARTAEASIAKTDRAAPAPAPAASHEAPSKEEVASFRALLRDGRTKVRAKDYAAGIALYEKALTIRPNDPRLLVELGYAALLLGDLDRAEAATERGLAGIRDPKLRGSALYNLGRIAQGRGDNNEAARRYRESLSVRPNATVEKQLAALGTAALTDLEAAFSPEPKRLLGPMRAPLPTLEAVCESLLAGVADQGGFAGCGIGAADSVAVDGETLVRALLLPVWVGYFEGCGLDGAAEVMRYLVIETPRGFFRTDEWVSYTYNPGAFGIWEEIEARLEVADLIPGEPPEIVMRATHHRGDTDLGVLEHESQTIEWALVCGLAGDTPDCFAKIPIGYSYERSVMELPEGESAEPVEHTPGLPLRSSYRYALSFDGKGGYTLTELEPPVGEAAGSDGARPGAFLLLETERR